MKLLKKHLHSLKELHTFNNMNITPILDMEAELAERDKDSCLTCKFYKDSPECDMCCNRFESFYTPRRTRLN